MQLTPRQQSVYEFLRTYVKRRGTAPTYEEIRRHFGFSSYNSVQKHLKQLEERGFIRSPWGNRKRALELVEQGRPTLTLPLLGTVAAGRPIEAVVAPEFLDVPRDLVGRGEHFLLRVAGESMIGDGILDGDLLVVERRETATNGDTVIALINGSEATVKRFYRRTGEVELRPANPTMSSIFLRHGDLKVQGVVRALLRQY